MKKVVHLLLFVFGASLSGQAQTDSTRFHREQEIVQTARTLLRDTAKAQRTAAAEAILPQLQQLLDSPQSFRYRFDSLREVSIQYPADSSFRIFTWQLYVNPEEYRYYGALQTRADERQLIPLRDASERAYDAEFDILDPESWYGVVYYNIQAFDTPEGPKYLLFGYDGYHFFDKRKIVDVLSFREGQPVFGAPVFATLEEGRGPITQNRLVREYSAASSIRCNYDPDLEVLILDHMASIRRPDGRGMSLLPDGTYEGYRYDKKRGWWVYEEKLFHEVLDSAPRPQPILGSGKKRDVFGNE